MYKKKVAATESSSSGIERVYRWAEKEVRQKRREEEQAQDMERGKGAAFINLSASDVFRSVTASQFR